MDGHDIVKEAALRRQRRSRKEADEQSIAVTPSHSHPEGNKKVSDISNFLTPLRDNGSTVHTVRRPFGDRPISHNNQTSLCFPFVDIQLFDKRAKALVNSCVLSSIINRNLYQNVFSCDVTKGHPGTDKAREIPVGIGGTVFYFDFVIRGDIPDMVLGMDFLTRYKCTVDFGNKLFMIQGDNDVTVKLISDRDLPLRYRQAGNLAASI